MSSTGIWSVKMISRTNLLAQTNFLVTPLSCEKFGKPIRDTQAVQVNAGSRYDDLAYPPEWEQYLVSKDKSLSLAESMEANSKRLGDELFEWIDKLVHTFYQIRETCSVDGSHSLVKCSLTTWSSFAPDPKSDVYSLET